MALFDQFPYTDLHAINLDWLIKWTQHTSDNLIKLESEFNALQEQVDDIGNNIGELVDKWLQEQGPEFVEKIVSEYITSSVYFGLTMDGYWVAYIPESWKSIQFETTGLDIELALEPEYGHLVLSY